MKTFKNTRAKHDGQSTSILFAKAAKKVRTLGPYYVECSEAELQQSKAMHLFTQAGVQYYGFL